MNAASPRSSIRSLFQRIPIPITVQESPKKSRKRSKPQEKPQPKPQSQSKPYRKKKITGALREAVWIKTMGRSFEGKCPVVWCPNTITVFDFQAGHNIPESKGGSTTLPNLIAICARCNFSMGNQYTIDEWNTMHAPGTVPKLSEEPQPQPQLKRSFFQKIFCCFYRR